MITNTQFSSRDGSIVILQDKSTWNVTDISGPIALPMWMRGDPIEAETFGIDTYIKNLRTGEKLKAKPQN